MRFVEPTGREPKRFQLSRDKLREAVHYICSRAPEDRLGNVKLHKILYFSDMFSFFEKGQPITGVEYIKQKFGPTARHLAAAVEHLKGDGVLNVYEDLYFGYRKKFYRSSAPYAAHYLSDDERDVLDEFTRFVTSLSANEVSEISHDAAWESVGPGEVIPYTSIFRVFAPEISQEDVNWGEDMAHKYAAAH